MNLVVARNDDRGSCIIDHRGDIVAWNEGDRNIIEAAITTDLIRSWDGGNVEETSFLQRRPYLCDTFTDAAALGPLMLKPDQVEIKTPTPVL